MEFFFWNFFKNLDFFQFSRVFKVQRPEGKRPVSGQSGFWCPVEPYNNQFRKLRILKFHEVSTQSELFLMKKPNYKQTDQTCQTCLNWSKFLWKFVFVVSELVAGSGDQDISKNLPWLLPVALTVTASIPLLFSALITWNLILISFCKEN